MLETHVLVTPNERLAREYQRAYANIRIQRSLDVGHEESAWYRPDIISLSRFLDREYQRLRAEKAELPNSASVGELYHCARMTSAHDARLSGKVADFVTAYRTIVAYEMSPESLEIVAHGRLSQWLRRFEGLLGDRNLVHAERIPELLSHHQYFPSRPVVLCTVERLSKLQQRYLYALDRQAHLLHLTDDGLIGTSRPQTVTTEFAKGAPQASVIAGIACRDLEEELLRATLWAAQALEDAEARVGIVIPALEQNYDLVTRIVGMQLDPEQGSSSLRFDISAGKSLYRQPVWQIATRLLRATLNPLDIRDVDDFANSKFLQLECLLPLTLRWPKGFLSQVSLERILKATEAHAQLQATQSLQVGQSRTLAEWVQAFLKLLSAMGWPNQADLASVQFQAYQAIIDVMYLQPDTDDVVSAEAALDILDYTLDRTVFAPERPAARLQVLGILETTGLQFSHLWVCGMDSGAFPGNAPTTPLLPRAICRVSGVPRSTQQQEREFAALTLQRLLAATGEFLVSYSRFDGEAECGPSPLFSDLLEWQATAVDNQLSNPYLSYVPIAQEPYADDRGTVFPESSMRGGTRVLEDQILCPFKAYAIHRLGLERREPVSDLPDARIRGSLLHQALYFLYADTPDQKTIGGFTDEHIGSAVDLAIAQVEPALPAAMREHEASRLRKLIVAWIEVELQREPFQVVAVEKTHSIDIAGIALTVRVDRWDALPDGSSIVIDYKTGGVTLAQALASPPTAPHLQQWQLFLRQFFPCLQRRQAGRRHHTGQPAR